MSFWDSDYEKYGYLSTVPLAEVPENYIQDRLKALIVEAIVKEESIGSAIIKDAMRPPALNMVSLYNSSQRQNCGNTLVPYKHWSQTTISATSEQKWANYWETAEGRPIQLQELESSFLNVGYTTLVYPQKVWGWNTYDDQCSNSPFAAQGATKLVSSEYQAGIAGYRFTFSNNAGTATYTKDVTSDEIVKVTGRADTPDGKTVVGGGHDLIAWAGYYTIVGHPELGNIYFYEFLDDGKSPDESDLVIPENIPTPLPVAFLPSIPIRIDNIPGHKYTTTQHAKNVAYAKKMGLDYDSISEEVNDNIEKDQVQDDVFVRVGIDITNPAPAATEYTMEFFRWYKSQKGLTRTRAEFEALFSGTIYSDVKVTMQFINTMKITDDLTIEDLFNISVNYIEIKTVTGSIGVVGTTEHQMFINQGNWSNNYRKYSKDRLHLRKQISATEYEEIIVGGPLFGTGIRNANKYENYVTNNLTGATQEGSNNFIIPVSINAYQAISYKAKKSFGYYALHLAVEGYVNVEIKWYQKTAFVYFVKFVGLALAMISYGQSIETFIALVEAYGLVGAVIISVAVSYGVRIGIELVLEFIAKEFGYDIAAYFAIVAAVVLAVYGQFSDQPLVSADTLMFISNGLMQGATTINQQGMEELQRQNEKYRLEADRLQAELDKALESLKTALPLDPMVLGRIDPLFIPGEEPDSYYNRTVHAGNVGIFGVEALHNYVKMALTLPKTPLFNSDRDWRTKSD